MGFSYYRNTMTPQEIFDKLLEQKTIAVSITGAQAESLRVQLVSKFSHYKRLLDDAGFLEGTPLENSVLKTVRKDRATIYQVAARTSRLDYTILSIDDNASSNEEKS